jgi:hypothetical protein
MKLVPWNAKAIKTYAAPTGKLTWGVAVFVATAGGIVADIGWQALVALVILPVVGLGYSAYRSRRSAARLGENIREELPINHAWLLEFMQSTYLGAGRDIIIRKNTGARITKYWTGFNVTGINCSNQQVIEGRNASDTPIQGISFALVGGSSIRSSSLGSKYATGSGNVSTPEFLVDEERFKVPFCRFACPISRNERFSVRYSDNWPGAMREQTDGFFFPEAMYFPSGVEELEVELQFDFDLTSITCLEANMDSGVVIPCETQPIAQVVEGRSLPLYTWKKFTPGANTIFILFYHAKAQGTQPEDSHLLPSDAQPINPPGAAR